MNWDIPDSPDIRWAERTGYPWWNQPADDEEEEEDADI